MIGSFWNFCRACPSMPIDKLHSEYRSTFQWHEYVGSSAKSTAAETQPPVVRQPSQSRNNESLTLKLTGRLAEETSFRRKKHPELTSSSSASTSAWLSRVVSPAFPEVHLQPEIHSTNIKLTTTGSGGASGSKSQNEKPLAPGGPKKSISLGTIRNNSTEATLVPINYEKQYLTDTADEIVARCGMNSSGPGNGQDFDNSIMADGNVNDGYGMSRSADAQAGPQQPETSNDPRAFGDHRSRKEYKSEYKKRFRPFSQYEYVDGKFFKKHGNQPDDNPWYKEVVELRKKAGEYKFRGWGAELGPENIAHAYHQHIWDQVSRRTSLAALALITTTPKSIIGRDEPIPGKENVKKSQSGRFNQHARPHTATPKHPISDLDKPSKLKDFDAVQPSKKKLLDESKLSKTSRIKEVKPSASRLSASSRSSTSTLSQVSPSKIKLEHKKFRNLHYQARSQSAGPPGRSPRKTLRQQSTASSISEKDGPGWKSSVDSTADVASPKAGPQQQRHPRPTTLATSPRPKASSGKGDRDGDKLHPYDKSSADPYLGYNEPVVKSPPEPTRVKSPEQVLLRSPDPVNWTVPLDTTKSFTVTQNIREAPPSPRFRAGDKSQSQSDTIKTQYSSTASTLASSPVSTFSPKSTAPGLSNSTNKNNNKESPRTDVNKNTKRDTATSIDSSAKSTKRPGTAAARRSESIGSSRAPSAVLSPPSYKNATSSARSPRGSSAGGGGDGSSAASSSVTTAVHKTPTKPRKPAQRLINGHDCVTTTTSTSSLQRETKGAIPANVATNQSPSKPTIQPRSASATVSKTKEQVKSPPPRTAPQTTLAAKSSPASKPLGAKPPVPFTTSPPKPSPPPKTTTTTSPPKASPRSDLAAKKAAALKSSDTGKSVVDSSTKGSGTSTPSAAGSRPGSGVSSKPSSITATSRVGSAGSSKARTEPSPTKPQSKPSGTVIKPATGISTAAPKSGGSGAAAASKTLAGGITTIPPQSSIQTGGKSKNAPGLKCLEDPTFAFDMPTTKPPTFDPMTTSMIGGSQFGYQGGKSSSGPSSLPRQISEPMQPSRPPAGPPKRADSIPAPPPRLNPPSSQSQQQSSKKGGSVDINTSTLPNTMPEPLKPTVLPMALNKSPQDVSSSAYSSMTSSIMSTSTMNPFGSTPGGSSIDGRDTQSSSGIPSINSGYGLSSSASSNNSSMIASTIAGPTSTTNSTPSGIPRSTFRVLEAPSPTTPPLAATQITMTTTISRDSISFIPPAPVTKKGVGGGVSHVSEIPPPPPRAGAGYRVLEAPDSDEPSVAVISPSTSRSRASDVLEKAKHKFDKFWGKGSKDRDSKDEEK